MTIEQPWLGKLSVAARIDFEEIQNFTIHIRAKVSKTGKDRIILQFSVVIHSVCAERFEDFF